MATMINDVDETLRELVDREVLNGGSSKVDVAFDAPTAEWAARRQGPAVNLYLYDIREDLERRRVAYEEVRNDQGRVVRRAMPPRKFQLSYLLTVWTARPEDEHRLLSAALACFLSFDAFPTDALRGTLADLDDDVRVTVAVPPADERGLSDIWLGLGGELKPSLDVVVTAPMPARTARELWIGPEVVEQPRISLAVPDGTPEQATPRPQPDAPPPDDAGDDEAAEAFQGGKPDTAEGRHFTIRSLPRH